MPRSALLLLWLSLGACAGGGGERPSVVLVLIDQLRADSAERWLVETRALAERGVRFENMRSSAPWTYPSVISLFSGLYPQQHGADGNQDGGLLTTFSEDVPLLPRTLGRAGYHTVGFVTNPFLHEWNPVHRAFAHYDPSFIRNQGPTRGHGELVWTERMYSDSVNAALREYFDARPRAAGDAPEFVYVHYIDVHGRKNDAQRWAGAPFAGTYEAATRYVDAKVRELYDYFLARSGGKLIFIVTSDHGQDVGDDLTVGEDRPWRERKASLHDFNLRIPCYILPSDVVPAGRVVGEPCSNVDVTPTLLDWLGIDAHAGAAGTSLLAALRGEPYDGRSRALYARNSAFGRLEDCVVHAGQKCMRYERVQRQSVPAHLGRRRFDLDSDPRELRDLGLDSACEALLLEAAGDRGVRFPAELQAPAPEIESQLHELGYGGGDDDGR